VVGRVHHHVGMMQGGQHQQHQHHHHVGRVVGLVEDKEVVAGKMMGHGQQHQERG
jgi:hypothetical protein